MTAPPRFSWAEHYRALLGVGGRESDADRVLLDLVANWLESWRAARGEIVAAHPAVDGTFEDPAAAFEQLRLLDAEFDGQLDNLIQGAREPVPDVSSTERETIGSVNDFIRTRMREDGFFNRIMPTIVGTPADGPSPYQAAWDRLISGTGIPAALLTGQADYRGPQMDYNGPGPSPDYVEGTVLGSWAAGTLRIAGLPDEFRVGGCQLFALAGDPVRWEFRCEVLSGAPEAVSAFLVHYAPSRQFPDQLRLVFRSGDDVRTLRRVEASRRDRMDELGGATFLLGLRLLVGELETGEPSSGIGRSLGHTTGLAPRILTRTR